MEKEKNYKRSLPLTLLSTLVSILFVGVMLGAFKYFYPGSEIEIMSVMLGIVGGLLAVSAFTDSRQQLTVKQDSLNFKNFKLKNVRSFAFGGSVSSEKSEATKSNFDLPYGKIERLEAGRDVLFWRQNLHMTVEDIATPVVISSAMKNHKRLYRDIVEQTQIVRPGVFVDKKLEKYLGL